MAYFPLFFDLKGKKVLVVGAGPVAERRIRKLCEFGAGITVVAKEAAEEVKKLAAAGKLCLLTGSYEEYREILWKEDYFLVFAATGSPETDCLVELDGRQQGAFVNVAGEKERSDFYVPGIARAGEVTVGITSGGGDYALARRMTERVQRFLTEEMETGG